MHDAAAGGVRLPQWPGEGPMTPKAKCAPYSWGRSLHQHKRYILEIQNTDHNTLWGIFTKSAECKIRITS